jgi:hypothetical protein
MITSFGGDRYFPPAVGAQTGEQQVSQLPARPAVAVAYAAIVGGKLRATFGPPAPGRAWLVRRMTVQNSETGRAYVYVGDEQPQNIVSGTRSGTFDENDPRQPYFVPEGSPLLVVWQSVTTGEALARIEYVEV